MTAAEVSVEVSVLVPIVERFDDLDRLQSALLPELEKLGRSYEILYLVSPEFDRAFQQAVELHEATPDRVRVMRFARPEGEATALATGFERSRGDVIVTMPAYFDADPAGLAALCAALDDGADMAFARRVSRRDGSVKALQTAVFNRAARFATGTDFRDLASGMRVLRREVCEEIPLYGDFHRFLPVLAHRIGFRVEEIDVDQDERAHAPSVYRPRTYLYRALDLLSMFFLSHFTRRPLRLFGALGSFFGAAGGLILLVVGVQRLMGEAIAGRPILILGTLLLGLGVQALTIGLLGELLLFFHARNIRDYRVAEIVEAQPPALPERNDSA